jgi:hypothetical protein
VPALHRLLVGMLLTVVPFTEPHVPVVEEVPDELLVELEEVVPELEPVDPVVVPELDVELPELEEQFGAGRSPALATTDAPASPSGAAS